MMIELSPRNLALVVFKRRKLCLIAFLVPVLACAIYLLVTPSQYISQASILLNLFDRDVASPDAADAGGGAPNAEFAAQMLNSQQMLMLSRDVLQKALEAVGVGRAYPKIAEKSKAKGLDPMPYAILRFQDDLEVTPVRETTVMLVEVKNHDPVVARDLNEALINAFLQQQALTTRDPRTQFLASQLEELKTRMHDAQKELLAHKSQIGVRDLDTERNLLLQQRDALQQALAMAQAELAASQGRIGAINKSLAGTSKDIPLSDENDAAQQTRNEARARLTLAQSRYQKAQQDYAPSNPQLADAKAQLAFEEKNYREAMASSNARVRTGSNPVYQTLQSDLATARAAERSAQADVQARTQQLDKIDKRLAYLDENATELQDLQHRYEVTLQDFKSYVSRTETARIMNDMNDAKITRSSVVQNPTLATKPSEPKTALLGILSLAAGVCISLGLCLLLELRDQTASTPEQLESGTGLPVLATLDYREMPSIRGRLGPPPLSLPQPTS